MKTRHGSGALWFEKPRLIGGTWLAAENTGVVYGSVLGNW